MYSPDRAYQSAMDKQGQEWIDEALALVPEGVHAQGHVVRAESIAEGLVEAATDPAYGIEAHFIVIGAAHRGLIGRFSIGSSAGSLLHSSPVPVALAPVDYEPHPAITRLTCATGLLPGAEVLVELAIGLADDWHVPLRLISLLAMGKERSEDARHEIHAIAERHVDDLVARANDVLPDDFPVTGVLGTGRSLEECVHALEFESSEIVDVVEVQYRIVESRRKKYRCGCGACVDTALPDPSAPETIIQGGRYSVDFAAKVAIDKYAHHLPLERQVRIMAQHGLIASSQTLWDQVYALATQLEPTWNQLLASLL